MKKLLVFILTAVLMLSCLTACDLSEEDKGVTIKEYENCAVFTFDNLPERETATFELTRTGLGEGAIYYHINLERGSLGISYKDNVISVAQSLGQFTADDEMPINGSGGYIEGDKIEISFGTLSPVKGEIIIAFTEDALKAVHGSLNHVLRNQAGCEWLNDITAEDIAEIKMISGGGGPLPPISFTYISSSTDKAVVSSIFEEYYWLEIVPISEEETRCADAGYFAVRFILNNGDVREISFTHVAIDFSQDSNGNYFKLVYLPEFPDGSHYINYYGFEMTWPKNIQLCLVDETPVCEIPFSEFGFIKVKDDISLDAMAPTHYIEIRGERVNFISEEYFYISNDRSVYYQLVDKNLDELIAEYSVTAIE